MNNRKPKFDRPVSRRAFLAGAGGVAVGLPFLEGLAPRQAKAATSVDPFAIFLREANGAAAEQNTVVGSEPERFWPTEHGSLTFDKVQGRALEELDGYLDRLLVVSDVHMHNFSYGDGHARGALQCLTARGPTVPDQGGSSEAAGESIDHRIGRELNPPGQESLVLYAGNPGGWLGGPCISYRGPADRRAATHNPLNGYQQIMGLDSNQLEELIARQESVNDLVSGQLESLMNSPKLSGEDRLRLELHFDSIRSLENNLTCNLADEELSIVNGLAPGYASNIGDEVLDAVRAHMHVAVLAVACGYTRSVSIQVGNGNDGTTRYRNLDDNSLMENFHYISHRRASHDNSGAIIAESDKLHEMVDRQFARAFRYLIERLAEYQLPDAPSLLDCGYALWFNDLGNGPAHSAQRIPTVIAGSAGGFLKQGEYIAANGGNGGSTHARLLNTLGSAAGLRNGSGELISDFGDPSLDRTPLTELLA